MPRQTVFSIHSREGGTVRKLAEGIETALFVGDNVMMSVVQSIPGAKGRLHSHPEEQWVVILKGGGRLEVGDRPVEMQQFDVAEIPGGVPHDFVPGPDGAAILDIFSPPRRDYLSPGEGFGTGAGPMPPQAAHDGAPNAFNLHKPRGGLRRQLADGIDAEIFVGHRLMLSVVRAAPGSKGSLHSHPEEQWGFLVEGSGTRTQDRQSITVKPGDFWLTAADVAHTFEAGPDGALILDVFSPPREAYRRAGRGFGQA